MFFLLVYNLHNKIACSPYGMRSPLTGQWSVYSQRGKLAVLNISFSLYEKFGNYFAPFVIEKQNVEYIKNGNKRQPC